MWRNELYVTPPDDLGSDAVDLWVAPTALPLEFPDPQAPVTTNGVAGTERWVVWAATAMAKQSGRRAIAIGGPGSYSYNPQVELHTVSAARGTAAEDQAINLVVQLAQSHEIPNIWYNGENARVCHGILQKLGELALPSMLRTIIHCSPNSENIAMVDHQRRCDLERDLASIIVMSEEQGQAFRQNGVDTTHWQCAESGVSMEESVFRHPKDDYNVLSKNGEIPDSQLLRDLQKLGIDFALNVGRHGPQKGLRTVADRARELNMLLILIGELDANSRRDTDYSEKMYRDYDVLHLDHRLGLSQEAYDRIRRWKNGEDTYPPIFRIGALNSSEKLPFIAYAHCGILGPEAELAVDEDGRQYSEAYCLVADEFFVNGVHVYMPVGTTMHRRRSVQLATSYQEGQPISAKGLDTSELNRRIGAFYGQVYYDIQFTAARLIEIGDCRVGAFDE